MLLTEKDTVTFTSFDLVEDTLFRITNDYYNDQDPSFGLSDQQVIFSSDRTGGKFSGKYNLFAINRNNYEITVHQLSKRQ